ncbi:TetR/AcrR family transcriptional regulator [Kitasatospora sp. LaBMicrA B282]|uniref:TetR/AcrR family transcriptional regulator n=1 Tax=Kitasatospora sp. LaBMicrA B282 TaxID=3420949 RepID=UPI003D139CCD
MPEKRKAIVRAARAVFGREGYTRTSVDTIAAEAGVSKRTIYNHFTDKEQLFQEVALAGATEVTTAQAAIADHHLHKIVDLEADLIAFALARVGSLETFSDHWALVRTIEAEAPRIQPAVLEAWQEAGPRETHRELMRRFAEFADLGLLEVADPDRAAAHFNLLTFISITLPSFYGAIPLGRPQVEAIVTDGVRTFLRLYRPGAVAND